MDYSGYLKESQVSWNSAARNSGVVSGKDLGWPSEYVPNHLSMLLDVSEPGDASKLRGFKLMAKTLEWANYGGFHAEVLHLVRVRREAQKCGYCGCDWAPDDGDGCSVCHGV